MTAEDQRRVDKKSMTNAYKTMAAGVALVVPAFCALLLPEILRTGIPTLLSPLPSITTIPAFFLARAGLQDLAIFVPTLLFFVWNPGLFRGETRIPIRSLVLLAVLTALTTVYFWGGWQYGLKYQGARFTYGTCIANVGWLLVLWAVFIKPRSKPSFVTNLLAHFLLFTWLAWYAFPYLGELP